jgi:hypothetical protein
VGAAQGAASGRGDRLALIRTAAATALVVSLSACGGDSGVDIDELRASGAPLYWLGEEFDGLPLVHASARGFIYGDCDPSTDTGCAPPLQLQHWPLAQRHPSKFTVTPGTPTSCTRGTVGSTRVASFPTTGGLEVYVGRTVVVVFAEWQRTLRAVKALRPLDGSGTLPKPPVQLERALARCRTPLRESSETSG